MSIRWRTHEMIFVSTLAAAQMIVSVLKIENGSYEVSAIDAAARFQEIGLSFVYWQNALLPQIASTLLWFLAYLSINLVVVPAIQGIAFGPVEKRSPLQIAKIIVAFIGFSYLLALGVNAVTFYARPHLFNYGGYQFLALFGYTDAPFYDVWLAVPKAMGFMTVLTIGAIIRDTVITFLNRPDAGRGFRVLVINKITPMFFIYCLIPCLSNPVREDFLMYLVYVTPVFVLYLYFTFSLFPFKADRSFTHRPVLIRLLLSTFLGALPFMLMYWNSDKPLAYWAFLLMIVTPLSWQLYQENKEKITALVGMESALAQTSADLQFLRSQINPHFLFNALNTLYGTALKEKAEFTAEGIQKLGDMMRFMLHENNLDAIPMHKELDYLRNYIDLQKLRTQTSPDILIEDNIGEAHCDRSIAPMLLIPFVENAFKHGISLREKSWIDIKLECTAQNIRFEVRNSKHVRSGLDTENEKSGIGLKNVAARLQMLYPGRHELQITEGKTEFIVKLILR